jgi:hypothetical protein
MAWLARDEALLKSYVFSFAELENTGDGGGWGNTDTYYLFEPERFERECPDLHLEPGEGPIEVEPMRKNPPMTTEECERLMAEGGCEFVPYKEDEPDGE